MINASQTSEAVAALIVIAGLSFAPSRFRLPLLRFLTGEGKTSEPCACVRAARLKGQIH